MAKGDIASFRIEAIAAGGAGLGRANGRPVFTEFTAPGDLVRVRITEEQKTWSRAELLELTEPSPQRTNPLCSLYGRCGGCSLQHLDYPAQLKAKEAILRKSFMRIGGINLPEITIRPSPPWEYRNRFQFHCIPGKRDRVGFKERKSGSIIPLEDCRVADPGIREALRKSELKRLVPPPQKDRFTVFSLGDQFLSEGGKSRGKICLKGRELRIDAGVFFQSNVTMLELLLEDLEALAGSADPSHKLGDIYCGVGTFAAFLGDGFPAVELVEENSSALALARENAGGKDRQFYALSSEEWVKSRKLCTDKWGLLILDPPRQGLSKPFRQSLAGMSVNVLAYVSCDPVTLARDSKDLIATGYRLNEIFLYDFYPQTSHIESLAVFMA